jgi:hypothetical protein
MPSRFRAPRATRLAVIAALPALAAGALVATPATATAPSTSVTILLTAPNPAGLDALANASGLSHAQRLAELAALVPSAADRGSVVDALHDEGFSIDHQTAWTIDATASQPTVTDLFGTNRARAATGQLVTTGALPDLPASLRGLVSAVLPNGNAPTAFQPKSYSGLDFRNAYTGVDDPPATGLGSAGTQSVTIASLQFSKWSPGDLTQYAKANSLPDPVAGGQYVSVPVGNAPTTSDGADEVDLDQESLLSTDPFAKQRAYFNAGTSAGYAAELGQVFADVTQSVGAVNGGDPHIVALSTSWGSCESEFAVNFPRDTINVLETLLKGISAAGVTIFAASGDDGVYDCGDSKTSTKVAVDYPASSPEVVAVGGTHLTAPGGRVANAGTNWAEHGWTCGNTVACEGASGSGGSGGGESSQFALPSYQKQGIGSQPFTTSTKKKGNFGTQPHRMVPDISADGDPETGFCVVTSDPADLNRPAVPCTTTPSGYASVQIGGTSLASPVSAALFTNQLSAAGRTTGIGSIHAALYSAYHDKTLGGFRDVTTGSNGRQTDVDSRAKSKSAAELPVTAQKGFDTVSGLGSVLWSRIDGYLFSPKAPRGIASLTLAKPHTAKHKYQVKVHWNYEQLREDGMLAGSAKVVVTKVGVKRPIYSVTHAPATGTHLIQGKPGGEYFLTVTPTSLTGAVGTPASTVLEVPFDNPHFGYTGTWKKQSNSGSFGGAIKTSAKHGSFATTTATGRTYSIGVRTAPSYGILKVYRGSKLAATIDLYSKKPGHKVVTFWGSPEAPLARRTFTFRYTGKHNAKATGKTVDVDALYVARE